MAKWTRTETDAPIPSPDAVAAYERMSSEELDALAVRMAERGNYALLNRRPWANGNHWSFGSSYDGGPVDDSGWCA